MNTDCVTDPETPSQSPIANPVGATALMVCAARALETEGILCSTPLFEDKFARVIGGDYGFKYLQALADCQFPQVQSDLRLKMLANAFVIRTVYFDNVIIENSLSLTDEKDNEQLASQLVILGVGGDARPYRMNFSPKMTVFEIDLPDVIEYKEKCFTLMNAQAACTIKRIGCNISDTSIWKAELEKSGFDPTMKTIFLAEGLLVYLSSDEIDSLVQTVSELCCSGSLFTGDVFSRVDMTGELYENMHAFFKLWGSPVKSGIPNPEELFEKYGFVTQVDLFGSEPANFGRVPEQMMKILKEITRDYAEEKKISRTLYFKAYKA